MKQILRFLFGNFRAWDYFLWLGSLCAITILYLYFGAGGTLPLIASLIGTTSLIFIAKGNVAGQALTVIFSVIYGVISYQTAYFGEMITYLGMTGPIAFCAVITWLRHPSESGHSVVEVRHLPMREYPLLLFLSSAVTLLFFFLLKYLRNENLLFSTLSVFTSFVAVYLTVRRSPLYALGYVANDVVLIVLWSMATAKDRRYFAMILCFAVFLVNDVYGFISWQRLAATQRRQRSTASPT